MKQLKWFRNNILLVIALFLLAFIPLYPKLPLLDVKNTWIYIRIEDFIVAVGLLVWFVQLIRKKASLMTPLTIPILIYWGVGLVSLVYAVVFLFPHLANVFPNVAVLYLLRHIEYLSVFFIAYSAVKQKKDINLIIVTIVTVLFAVSFYGFGQKGVLIGWENRFPAFSTMSEEFSKGIPLLLSTAGRVQSTFAGHYDLAAYLILLIPLMASLIIGVKKWWKKLFFLAAWVAGLVLLLMTASRVSFAVYLVAISVVFVLQKQKRYILPAIIGSILLLNFFQGISQRFASTISSVDTVIDARTGKVVGMVESNPEGGEKKIVIKQETPTGESLPVSQSGIINIPSTQEEQKTVTVVQMQRKKLVNGKEATEITNVEGDFVIKRTLAYDISFTTRFQGEWPRAMEAFNRNILTGSGYSSINAATDNNYLRILGETGLLGFLSFTGIFLIMCIYTFRVLPDVDSPVARSFVLGSLAGLVGLGLNAILIDVFEASKVAFVMWLLIGLMLGILRLYQKHKVNYVSNLRTVFTSIPAVFLYILGGGAALFSRTLQNYFVADDFTWLRWVADCKKIVFPNGDMNCEPTKTAIMHYFTSADGFFYRPGMKIYFSMMYPFAWLNASPYHIVSILLHVAVSCLIYVIALKLLRHKVFALLTASFFLVLSSHSETVLWISSVGHLFAAFFTLFALVMHIYWRETKRIVFMILAILGIIAAPLFQEVGIAAPLLVIFYDIFVLREGYRNVTKRWYYFLYFIPLPIYLIVRSYAKSHWSGGDYSYNLIKLPYNIVGNFIGYIFLSLAGTQFLPVYNQVRTIGKSNQPLVIAILILLIIAGYFIYKLFYKHIDKESKSVSTASLLFFVIPLLTVLPLGNIAARYVYLASFGSVLFLVYIMKLLYMSISKTSKYAAITALVILVLGFSYYQISGLMQSNQDWKRAGEITDRLVVDINYAFPVQKATPPDPVFYFVNVPAKLGEAWVFPVGLPDALWFSFQKENLTVHARKDLNLALDEAEGSSSARVFEFAKDGTVEQVIRTKTIEEQK